MQQRIASLLGVRYKDPVYDESAHGPVPTVERYNTLTKVNLLMCIKPKDKVYVADEMCKAAGVLMVRLPPYHCEFNPIEMGWAYGKDYVKKHNVTYNLKYAMQHMRAGMTRIGPDLWKKFEDHAIKEEEISWKGDALWSSTLETLRRHANADARVTIVVGGDVDTSDSEIDGVRVSESEYSSESEDLA